MEYAIQILDGNKHYKLGGQKIFALRNINLDIIRGEFVSIVGPSGSGKSTIMNMIGGLDFLTSGTIIAEGNDISKMNDKQQSVYRNKKIGFVFQNFNLDNNLNAGENVEMPLFYAGVKKTERRNRAIEALKIVGLEKRIHHRPNEMSGGQKQRCAIARAIVNSPKILLADEPTGNLDSDSGSKIFKLLTEINLSGVTVIMVTHNYKQAENTQRIIEIADGRILADSYCKNKNNSV